MRIKDKLDYSIKTKPFTLTPQAMVQEALTEMCEKNFGSVIVINDQEHVVGILTERDMMRRVLYKKLNPETTKIEEVMSENIKVAKETDVLADWLQIMTTQRFRHLPIVNEDGQLINMMSQGDFVSYTWPDLFEHLRKTVKEKFSVPFQVIMIILALAIIALLALEKFG